MSMYSMASCILLQKGSVQLRLFDRIMVILEFNVFGVFFAFCFDLRKCAVYPVKHGFCRFFRNFEIYVIIYKRKQIMFNFTPAKTHLRKSELNTKKHF